jgi:hypothetical protein
MKRAKTGTICNGMRFQIDQPIQHRMHDDKNCEYACHTSPNDPLQFRSQLPRIVRGQEQLRGEDCERDCPGNVQVIGNLSGYQALFQVGAEHLLTSWYHHRRIESEAPLPKHERGNGQKAAHDERRRKEHLPFSHDWVKIGGELPVIIARIFS